MSHKAFEVVVLNTIQAAAADIILSGGKLNINDGTSDLSTPVHLMAEATDFTETAYSAGVLSQKDYDFAAVTLAANSQYRLAVVVPASVDFTGGGQEANELIPIREYVVWSGSTVPTANSLRDDFIARINADNSKKVTASNGGAGILTLDLDLVTEGDFNVESPAGTVETVVIAYVAPAGTPAIVAAVAPNLVSNTATYRTYELVFDRKSKNGLISGGKVLFSERVVMYVDEGAANFAAFDTEMDAVIAGTHTPVADYLGV